MAASCVRATAEAQDQGADPQGLKAQSPLRTPQLSTGTLCPLPGAPTCLQARCPSAHRPPRLETPPQGSDARLRGEDGSAEPRLTEAPRQSCQDQCPVPLGPHRPLRAACGRCSANGLDFSCRWSLHGGECSGQQGRGCGDTLRTLSASQGPGFQAELSPSGVRSSIDVGTTRLPACEGPAGRGTGKAC